MWWAENGAQVGSLSKVFTECLFTTFNTSIHYWFWSDFWWFSCLKWLLKLCNYSQCHLHQFITNFMIGNLKEWNDTMHHQKNRLQNCCIVLKNGLASMGCCWLAACKQPGKIWPLSGTLHLTLSWLLIHADPHYTAYWHITNHFVQQPSKNVSVRRLDSIQMHALPALKNERNDI